jgi:hypothetical protein
MCLVSYEKHLRKQVTALMTSTWICLKIGYPKSLCLIIVLPFQTTIWHFQNPPPGQSFLAVERAAPGIKIGSSPHSSLWFKEGSHSGL